MDEERPWPTAGDRLFGAGAEWRANACLGWDHEGWGLYAAGYLRAADILVERVCSDGRGQDVLVYPIVFLFRQYLELALKRIVIDGARLLDEPAVLPQTHKLTELWRRVRPILERVWPNEPPGDLDAVADVIAQFETADPKSLVFRYPVDRAGNLVIDSPMTFNIRGFSDVMRRTAELLEGSIAVRPLCSDAGAPRRPAVDERSSSVLGRAAGSDRDQARSCPYCGSCGRVP